MSRSYKLAGRIAGVHHQGSADGGIGVGGQPHPDGVRQLAVECDRVQLPVMARGEDFLDHVRASSARLATWPKASR